MEVRFFLTQEDLLHFNVYIYTHQLRRSVWFILITSILLILCALLTFPSAYQCSIVFFLASFVLPLLLVLRARRAASRAAGWAGEHVVSIMPDGIQEKTDESEGTGKWSTIKNVDQDKYNIYFILKASSSNIVVARIIPKRAFPNPQEAEMFLNQARRYWRSAHQDASVVSD